MNNNLSKWASSFSGCDGGNPNANIWLCGIEWGYEKATAEERDNYYNHELPKEIENGGHELNTNYNFFSDEIMGFPFNLAFAKLYSAIENKSMSNLAEGADEILKLNLSPIAFRKDDENLWGKNIIKATGFKTKSIFIEYLNSLKRFSTITKKYNPKLIVCIGNGYKNNFFNSFFGKENTQFNYETIKPDKNNKNQNNRYIYHVKQDETLLVITPFSTSSNGLNSDYLLQKTGEKIRELLKDKHIKELV